MTNLRARKKSLLSIVQKIDPAGFGGVAGDYEEFVNGLIKFVSGSSGKITPDNINNIWKNYFNTELQLNAEEYSELISRFN